MGFVDPNVLIASQRWVLSSSQQESDRAAEALAKKYRAELC